MFGIKRNESVRRFIAGSGRLDYEHLKILKDY